MDNAPTTAGNPVAAAKSVWTSTKFRSAVYSAIATVLSTFVTGFLASLIPKLGAEQVTSLAQWVAGIVGGGFLTAIGGSAYVDGQVQAAQSPVAAQAAVAQATLATAQAQATTATAQAQATTAQATTAQAQATVAKVQAQATVAKVQEVAAETPR